jgi:hypothetical protein
MLSRLRLRNLFPQFAGTLAKETQQAGVYFFRVRPRDTVRAILHDQLARSFDGLWCKLKLAERLG